MKSKNNKQKPVDIPITYEQAHKCLNIKPDDRVHSFWNRPFLSGADLDLPRVEDMLKSAASVEKLFLSDTLGFLDHDILAWDEKHSKWTFLECESKKVAILRQKLNK